MFYFKIILGIVLAFPAFLVLFTLFIFISGLFVNTKEEYTHNHKFYRHLINFTVWLLCKIARVRIHVEGMEKVPQNSRFVLVGNHRSKFDPMISWLVLKKFDVAFLSKKENFSIPIFGKCIRPCCFKAIDRENPRNALKTIYESADLIMNDEVSIGVYPEGTRSKDDQIHDFHNGVFKIAQRANVPIVVLAIYGTDKIAKNFPKRHTDVYLIVVETIPADYVNQSRTAEIGDRVRDDLEKSLAVIK